MLHSLTQGGPAILSIRFKKTIKEPVPEFPHQYRRRRQTGAMGNTNFSHIHFTQRVNCFPELLFSGTD
jgi:hypothetical protein